MVVIPGDLAAIRAGVDDLRIMRIGRDVSAFTSAHRIPIRTIDSTPLRRRSAYCAVVLLSAINEIREAIVGNHMVELRRRLVPLRSPTCAAIGAYIGSAIVGFNHPVGIVGIDPKPVIVSMRNTNIPESLSAVIGAIHSCIKDVNTIYRARVGKDMRVIKRPLAIATVVVGQGPVFAPVIGAE